MKKRIRRSGLLILFLSIFSLMAGAAETSDITPSEVHFEKIRTYSNHQFSDVVENSWYASSVKLAYEYSLMKGNSDTTFNPEGNVTVAEAVTMAARIHSLYTTGAESFVQDSKNWAKVYLDYALENQIIRQSYYDCDVSLPATRAQFAEIFAAALPEEGLASINAVSADSIPDVRPSATYTRSVCNLYRAGILEGSNDEREFLPQTNIRRSEAAAIVTRMAESSVRKKFTLTNESGEISKPHSYDLIVSDISWSDAFVAAQNAGGYLARINTLEEYNEIVSLIQEKGLNDKRFRIGARRNPSEEKYYWVDDTNMTYGPVLNSNTSWTDSYWDNGEPTFSWKENIESVVELHYNSDTGKWLLNDLPDKGYASDVGTYAYIIEYDEVFDPVSNEELEQAEKFKNTLEKLNSFDAGNKIAESVGKIADPWRDKNGYIEQEDAKVSSEAVYAWTRALAEVGVIQNTAINDISWAVTMTMNDGTLMFYAPDIEGVNSGDGGLHELSVCTFDSEDEKMRENIIYTGGKKANCYGDELNDSFNEITNYNFSSGPTTVLNVRSLLNMIGSRTRVVFWEGHGNLINQFDSSTEDYDDFRHYVLSIDEEISEDRDKDYRGYLNEKSVVKQIIKRKNGEIVQFYAITEKFFTRQIKEKANNAYFVSGSCYSYNNPFADALKEKGFNNLVLNAYSVDSYYARDMLYEIAKNLSKKDEYNRLFTAEKSFDDAKKEKTALSDFVSKTQENGWKKVLMVHVYQDDDPQKTEPPFRVVPLDDYMAVTFKLLDADQKEIDSRSADITLVRRTDQKTYHALYHDSKDLEKGYWTTMEPGDYHLTINVPGYPIYEQDINIPEGNEDDDVVHLICQLDLLLRLHIVDEDGSTIENPVIDLSDGKKSYPCVPAVDDKGASCYDAKVPAGNYHLKVSAEEYESYDNSNLELKENKEMEIVLQGDNWLKAYAAYLKSLGSSNPYAFALAYVDEDGIPEMLLSAGVAHVNTSSLLVYKDKKVQDLGIMGDYGYTCFAERKGIIRKAVSINGGIFIDTFYRLNNGELSQIHEFYKDASNANKAAYRYNGKSIDQSSYKTKYNEAYDAYQWSEFSYYSGHRVTSSNIQAMLEDYTKFLVS